MVAVLYFTSPEKSGLLFWFQYSLHLPHPHLQTHICFSFQIWILCQNSLTRELKIRVVGFVLRKLFIHFDMLIVSHALLTVCYTVLVSVLDNHVSVEQLMSKET